MRNSIRKEPQIKAPRVAPLEGAFTYAPTGAYVSMHSVGHDTDERRFIESGIKRIFSDYIYSNLINSPQSLQRLFTCLLSGIGNVIQQRNGTRMTRIRRIFTDTVNPCVSVLSVFYYIPSCTTRASAFIRVHLRLNNRAGGV